jgi:V/A-type H+-transporting ATPase subunit E
MKTLEPAQDKIQKICNELRENTLEPAKKEAEGIIADAKARAQDIIRQGEAQVEQLLLESRRNIEQEHNIFQSSLSQGIKQSLESLRQDIEHKLFNDNLSELVKSGTNKPDVISKLIECIIKAIDKEGMTADLSVIIPKNVSDNEVNQLLGHEILEKLKKNSVSVGNFEGGAQIKVESDGLTIDITDSAIKELLARYIRKDFRKMIFKDNV